MNKITNEVLASSESLSAKQGLKVTSVYDYFEMMLGCQPDEDSLKELPINSPCGLDCVKAINAVKTLQEIIDRSQMDSLMSIANDTVETFWIG